jgi:hypothetical protein
VADNLTLNAGSGGATCLTDDCTTGHAQVVKLAVATNGSATQLGGFSTYHAVSAGSTNVANIKASAGQVYGIDVFNNAAYPIYVKLHNTAGTPTAGAGVVRTFGVQAGVRGTAEWALGLAFATGIGISILKDITDAGTTAVLASDCVVDIAYQ